MKVLPQRRVDAFLVCTPGLEPLVLAEAVHLGVRPARTVRGGVECTVTWPQLRALNLWSRVATRVLVRVARFHADGFDTLRRGIDSVEWSAWLAAGDGVHVVATTDPGSKLYHSEAVAERVRAAVGPFAGTVHVRVQRGAVTVSVDASGDPLYRRGWRGPAAKAPLRETLAAATLLASGWDRRSPLADPMCGSGTLVIEAALLARRVAPGSARTFAFEAWPTFDRDGWERQRAAAAADVLDRCPVLTASDRDEGAVTATTVNAAAAGVSIEIERRSISDLRVTGGRGWLVTNPPYGHRIRSERDRRGGDVRNLADQIGHVVRRAAPGWRVALLAPPDAPYGRMLASVGATERALTTTNGGIPVVLDVTTVPMPG